MLILVDGWINRLSPDSLRWSSSSAIGLGTITLGGIGGTIFGGKGATRTGAFTGRIGARISPSCVTASKLVGLFVMSFFGTGSEKKNKWQVRKRFFRHSTLQ